MLTYGQLVSMTIDFLKDIPAIDIDIEIPDVK